MQRALRKKAAGQRDPPVPGFDDSLEAKTFSGVPAKRRRPRIEGRSKPLIWFETRKRSRRFESNENVDPGWEVMRSKSALIDGLR